MFTNILTIKKKERIKEMVDFNFLLGENSDAEVEKTETEVVQNDRPAGRAIAIPAIPKGTMEAIRASIKSFDEKVAIFHNEAVALEAETQEDLSILVERIGMGKKLIKAIEDSGKAAYGPHKAIYKEGLNIVNYSKGQILEVCNLMQKKVDAITRKLELKRIEAERKAKAEQKRIQDEIDAARKKEQEAENKAAKKEGREAITVPEIIIDAPIVPQSVGVKTEHGTLKTEKVLEHRILKYGSPDVLKIAWDYAQKDYKNLVDKAFRRAIKSGAVGVGVSKDKGFEIVEVIKAKHRKK